jgi:hypothetical protein
VDLDDWTIIELNSEKLDETRLVFRSRYHQPIMHAQTAATVKLDGR